MPCDAQLIGSVPTTVEVEADGVSADEQCSVEVEADGVSADGFAPRSRC